MFINRINWLLFTLDNTFIAINLKNPTSSRKIEINVIEKNNNKIFNGLIEELLINSFFISFKSTWWKQINKSAPIKQIIQYKLILKFFIFIEG